MSGASLRWIDWRLAGKALRREAAGRFVLLFVLGVFFLAMLASSGVNRFLAGQWSLTAILKTSVTPPEGQGLAARAVRLPPVREAVYREPDAAWREFAAAYPGLEPLRQAVGNPLPGYVEIRLRPECLTEEDIAYVASALRPLPQVEKILSGGEALPRILRLKRWANAALWTGFGLLCAAFLGVLRAQERARAATLLPDFAFLADKGAEPARLAHLRAEASGLTGALLTALALGGAAMALYALALRYPFVRLAVGPPDAMVDPARLPYAALFILLSALASGAATLLGMRREARSPFR